ncbi:DUF1449 family protein [Gammaproteobacteria bacterium]|nr:DUF1449 family protein [Gammaproteobacteria bacterium]
MYAYLSSPPYYPFTAALIVVLILCGIEIVGTLLGFSMTGDSGSDVDAPDIEAGVDTANVDVELGPDINADVDSDLVTHQTPSFSASFMSWLGMGKVPFLVWLIAACTVFGLMGIAIQLVTEKIGVGPLMLSLAVPLALAAASLPTRWFCAGLAKVLPKEESSAISHRSLGGRVGVVTGAEGKLGRPTECRVVDGYDQTHYVLVEPTDVDVSFANGDEVFILRDKPKSNVFKAIPLVKV